jgi:hypothetical protein
MAKALFGHVGVTDPRTAAMQREVAMLRARVADLETALDREARANADLQTRLELVNSMSISDDHLLELDREPALT